MQIIYFLWIWFCFRSVLLGSFWIWFCFFGKFQEILAMPTHIVSGTVRANSVWVEFICECDKRIGAQVFRNKLFFIPVSSETTHVVTVEWIGEEGMEVTVVCPHCLGGCRYRGITTGSRQFEAIFWVCFCVICFYYYYCKKKTLYGSTLSQNLNFRSNLTSNFRSCIWDLNRIKRPLKITKMVNSLSPNHKPKFWPRFTLIDNEEAKSS